MSGEGERYKLRDRRLVNYKDTIALPRCGKSKKDIDTLYPVEEIKHDGNRVLIHYIGYDHKYDEWRDKDDIVDTGESRERSYQPFNPYSELGYQIKLALDSKRRKEPDVRIEMPFDRVLFDGGLKQAGVFQGFSHGHKVYSISQYNHLDSLVGEGWWYRCLNKHMNFCYVNRETIQFYLHHRSGVPEYDPAKGVMTKRPGGCVLIFKFVRMDGVAQDWSTIIGN